MEVDFCIPVCLNQKKPGMYLHRCTEQTNEDEIVLRLSAFKEDFYIKLSPDSSFIPTDSLPPQIDPTSSSPFAAAEFRECFYSW